MLAPREALYRPGEQSAQDVAPGDGAYWPAAQSAHATPLAGFAHAPATQVQSSMEAAMVVSVALLLGQVDELVIEAEERAEHCVVVQICAPLRGMPTSVMPTTTSLMRLPPGIVSVNASASLIYIKRAVARFVRP